VWKKVYSIYLERLVTISITVSDGNEEHFNANDEILQCRSLLMLIKQAWVQRRM